MATPTSRTGLREGWQSAWGWPMLVKLIQTLILARCMPVKPGGGKIFSKMEGGRKEGRKEQGRERQEDG